jgi:8-oxo-dGTP pyrophosphatase MutT (NUDIX family)
VKFMELRKFLNELEIALQNSETFGKDSHLKMSPMIGTDPYRTFEPSGTATKSAVLLLLIGKSFEKLEILFTLRSPRLPLHKNQISFPGGHCEGNEDEIHTALRETNEEIGLATDKIRILGKLSKLYVPPSDTVIHPIVGYLDEFGKMSINKKEVEEVFLVPLSFFLDQSNRTSEVWDFEGQEVQIPLWRVHPKVPLWGATAMILSEFIDIVYGIISNEN